jgi:hypothetical protein
MNKSTYATGHIIAILDSYIAVDGGAFDQDTSQSYNKRTKGDTFRAPYENSIIAKADIDIAIDQLSDNPGRWLHYCKHIEDKPAGYGLSQRQYIVADYIRGNEYINVVPIAKVLSQIA